VGLCETHAGLNGAKVPIKRQTNILILYSKIYID